MFKLSNEACLAPTIKTTKNTKWYKWREIGSNVVCFEWGPLHLYLYMFEVCLAGDKLGNYVKPPLQGINEALEERWAEPLWWRCGRTLPGLSLHRLCLVGLLVDLERSHGGAWPRCVGWMGLHCFPWHWCCIYTFVVAPFDYISTIFAFCVCKLVNLQYMWKYVNMNNICM
jgi:hypothetical protein